MQENVHGVPFYSHMHEKQLSWIALWIQDHFPLSSGWTTAASPRNIPAYSDRKTQTRQSQCSFPECLVPKRSTCSSQTDSIGWRCMRMLTHTHACRHTNQHTNKQAHKHTHRYTLTEHFIRNTTQILGRAQNRLNSLWHGFVKMLKTFLWDSVPRLNDCFTQFLLICQLHIHAVNLPFNHILKVFYWIQIRWLGRALKKIEPLVMFMKPVWVDFRFVTLCIIMLGYAGISL